MPADIKPARQYTKLIDDLKALQQRNKELEAEARRTASRIQDAVDTALASTNADHVEALRQATALHAETLSQVAALHKELVTTTASLSTTTTERDEVQRDLLAATVRADGLAAQVADIQPQLELLEQKRVDLSHLLDTVRGRMRRKEQQDEQAILNRRTLASVTPKKNWG